MEQKYLHKWVVLEGPKHGTSKARTVQVISKLKPITNNARTLAQQLLNLVKSLEGNRKD